MKDAIKKLKRAIKKEQNLALEKDKNGDKYASMDCYIRISWIRYSISILEKAGNNSKA